MGVTSNEQSDATDRPKKRGETIKAFLAADRTPMWFSIFLLLLGGMGTYFLAPRVNAQFEEQKIKSDFVIKNYGDLRAKMEDFQGLYVTAVQKLAAGEDVRTEVGKLQELIARISAQNLALLPMFSTEAGPKAASQLNAALNGMIQVLFANAGKKMETEAQVAAYTAEVEQATKKMVVPLLELYVRIGDVGRLRPIEKDRQLPQD
jgi:hypothetical protein